MNYKNLAISGAAAAVMLAAAVPAFAVDSSAVNISTNNENKVVVKNHAKVKNTVYSESTSGGNKIKGEVVAGGSITTASATSNPTVTNDVNGTSVTSCGCLTTGISTGNESTVIVKNNAKVKNYVDSSANSGENAIKGDVITGGMISTGAATSNPAVTNTVNTTVVM